MQRVVKAMGQPAAKLLAPTLAKAAPSLERRRLMPLRHLAMQTGNAAAITYCIQQRPPLLPLTQAHHICTPAALSPLPLVLHTASQCLLFLLRTQPCLSYSMPEERSSIE